MSKWETLGKHTKIKTGKLDANANSVNGQYPFFTCSKIPMKIDNYSYDCECVLVAGNGDLNVKYYEGKFDAYQRTYIVESSDRQTLDMKYLFYFLDKYVEKLREMSIGGVIKYIKLGYLTDAKIPLPPLAVQKKIADTLDRASALIEKRKAQIAKLDLLVKSQFIEMFGEGLNESAVELKDVCAIITDGTHQSPKFTNMGIPFLLVSNIVDNELNFNTKKFISREEYITLIKRTPVEVDDLLLTIVGSYGNPAVIKTEREFCFQRHIAYLKPKREIIDSLYLHAVFLSGAVKAQIEARVKGVAQKTLNLSELKKIKVNLPSIVLQNRFANFVRATEKSKAEMQRGLHKLELLYKSLMQKCFAGEMF